VAMPLGPIPDHSAAGQPPEPRRRCPHWLLAAVLQLHGTGCCRVFRFWFWGFQNFGHSVMDRRAGEAIVCGRGDEAGD